MNNIAVALFGILSIAGCASGPSHGSLAKGGKMFVAPDDKFAMDEHRPEECLPNKRTKFSKTLQFSFSEPLSYPAYQPSAVLGEMKVDGDVIRCTVGDWTRSEKAKAAQAPIEPFTGRVGNYSVDPTGAVIFTLTGTKNYVACYSVPSGSDSAIISLNGKVLRDILLQSHVEIECVDYPKE